MIRLALATAVAAAILSAGAASAAEYRIPIGDIDFATPEGASAFDLRVRGFANSACMSGGQLDQARCRRDFRNEALSRLPVASRDDYARVRAERITVHTPAVEH